MNKFNNLIDRRRNRNDPRQLLVYTNNFLKKTLEKGLTFQYNYGIIYIEGKGKP